MSLLATRHHNCNSCPDWATQTPTIDTALTSAAPVLGREHRLAKAGLRRPRKRGLRLVGSEASKKVLKRGDHGDA